jgi:hypothetical protein
MGIQVASRIIFNELTVEDRDGKERSGTLEILKSRTQTLLPHLLAWMVGSTKPLGIYRPVFVFSRAV